MVTTKVRIWVNTHRCIGVLSTFRPLTLRLLFIFNFSFLILSCGLDIENSTPPSKPQWVPKSLPVEWPERGIDAHESGGIFLEWEPNPEDNIVAYLIYCSRYYNENDSLGDYELLHRQDTESMDNLGFLHSDVNIRVKYYYKLKAEDAAENYSDFSDSLFYTLLPPLPYDGLLPNGSTSVLQSARQLSWFYDYYIAMENYCLTILSQDNDFILRTIISPTGYVSRTETWIIPESVVLNSKQIYKWRIDIGAEYIYNRETLGSESIWATFLFDDE